MYVRTYTQVSSQSEKKRQALAIHPGDFSSVINDYESGILDLYYVAPSKYPASTTTNYLAMS